jgi:hypothetical protein
LRLEGCHLRIVGTETVELGLEVLVALGDLSQRLVEILGRDLCLFEDLEKAFERALCDAQIPRQPLKLLFADSLGVGDVNAPLS